MLNSDVARFTTHIKPVLQQIRLLIGLNKRGKTRNIAIQRVLQQCQLQCCKTSCTFFLARFSVLLCTSLRRFRRETSVSIRKKYRLEPGVVNSLPLREISRDRFVLKPKFSGDLFFLINKRSILVAKCEKHNLRKSEACYWPVQLSRYMKNYTDLGGFYPARPICTILHIILSPIQ